MTKTSITLYGCRNSRSLRALWALEEAGVEYAYRHIDLFSGEGRAQWFRALNPAGKVPLLQVGEQVLTESVAIVTWVGETQPHSGLVPLEANPRAQYLRWCCFALSELEQPLWSLAKHRFILPKELRLSGMEQTARWEFARAGEVLAGALEHSPYILGEAFGAADILLGHCLAWALSMKLELEANALRDYWQRLSVRPALERARERERSAAE